MKKRICIWAMIVVLCCVLIPQAGVSAQTAGMPCMEVYMPIKQDNADTLYTFEDFASINPSGCQNGVDAVFPEQPIVIGQNGETYRRVTVSQGGYFLPQVLQAVLCHRYGAAYCEMGAAYWPMPDGIRKTELHKTADGRYCDKGVLTVLIEEDVYIERMAEDFSCVTVDRVFCEYLPEQRLTCVSLYSSDWGHDMNVEEAATAVSDHVGGAICMPLVWLCDGMTEMTKGDINKDGAVNINDAVQLYYHVNGKTQLADESIADITGDGAVTIADAVQLYYFVNGKDVEADIDGLLYNTAQLDTLPVGDDVAYTVASDSGDMGGSYQPHGAYVYLVHSLDELQALYARDGDATHDYTEGYTEDYFEDGALAIVRMHCGDLPHDVKVEEVVKKDGELAVTLCRYYGFGREEPLYRHTFVLETAAADLADVTSTAAFVYEVSYYPVTEADEKPTGDDVAFTAVANKQTMGGYNGENKAMFIRSAKDLAVARDLLTDEQYAAFDESYFEENTLLLVTVHYPDCAGELYADALLKNGSVLNVSYVYETNGTSLPAFSDRLMLLELDAADAADIRSFNLFGETVYVE